MNTYSFKEKKHDESFAQLVFDIEDMLQYFTCISRDEHAMVLGLQGEEHSLPTNTAV